MPKRLATDSLNTLPELANVLPKKIPNPTKGISDYLKLLQSNSESLFLTPTHEIEIKQLVSALPSKTSSGHDNISKHIAKRNYRSTC